MFYVLELQSDILVLSHWKFYAKADLKLPLIYKTALNNEQYDSKHEVKRRKPLPENGLSVKFLRL